MTRNRLQSRKTCNGLPSKDPLVYAGDMKLLASILMATLLATVAQPTAAQTSKIPNLFFEQPTILSAALQVMGNVSKALGVIKKSCDANPPKLDSLSKKNQLVWPLAKDPRIMNWVTNCKRQLKQKGVNTKGTDALWLIVNKFLSLTKKEWLLIKSLGPDDETKKNLFKKKR